MVLFEVESKAVIRDVKELRRKIKKIAVFRKRELRGDDYFSMPTRGYPTRSFRIRYDGRRYVLTFKKKIESLYSEDIVVKKEFEFTLSDGGKIDNFLYFLEDLGFKKWVKKRKHTESYQHKKDRRVVIEINKVEHLGYYLEVEYLAKRNEIRKAKEKIRGVLKEIGIRSKDIDNVGYTKRLYAKKRRRIKP